MKAPEIFESLRTAYNGNRLQFDFTVTSYCEGDRNKHIRQELIKLATGRTEPLTRCTVFAVSNALKNSFDQLSIF